MESNQQLASCPYNPNHRFKFAKYHFHLARCKDKIKVQHLFTTCVYNVGHIVRKDQVIDHQETCPDKEKHMRLVAMLNEPPRDTHNDISGSSNSITTFSDDDIKQQQRPHATLYQILESEEQEDFRTLSACMVCQKILECYYTSSTEPEPMVEKLLKKIRDVESSS